MVVLGVVLESEAGALDLPASAGRPILVELFTSQGCSSCPPADQLLEQLQDQHGDVVLPLSFHVDYWNYLGWKDPHSQKKFTKRQRQYNALLQSKTYTPQMVVDGKFTVSGLHPKAVAKQISNAAIAYHGFPIHVTDIGSHLQIIIDVDRLEELTDLHVVSYKDRVTTKVTRGENRGKTITNRNVVTKIDSYPVSWGATQAVEVPKPKRDNIVILIQGQKTGRIFGVKRL